MRCFVRGQKLPHLRHIRENDFVRNMGKEVAILADKLGQHHPSILSNAKVD
jgi:hypothetical protein